MIDSSKFGKDWSDDELDAIVADYFAMLTMDAADQPFVKAHRARALDEQIGRGHKSIEFKHMNISAVASELGLPFVRGYRPMANYQAAIFPAIDRYLSSHPDAWMIGDARFIAVAARLTAASGGAPGVGEAAAVFSSLSREERTAPVALSPLGPTPIFETPPDLRASRPRPMPLQRLVRKFDPAARDARNRALGLSGEERVFHAERARLIAAERADLARKVEWTSQERGDGAGYDIRSYDLSGEERFIEVKSTKGGPRTDFFLSRNERAFSDEEPERYRLFRLYDAANAPKIFKLKPPLDKAVRLETETWRAGF